MSVSKTLELPFWLPGMNDILNAQASGYRSGKKRVSKYSLLKKKYGILIGQELLVQGCIPATPYKRIWLTITWFESKKKRDPDNVRAGVKFILDAMVSAGVIEDDGIENIDSISDAFELAAKRSVNVVWGEA